VLLFAAHLYVEEKYIFSELEDSLTQECTKWNILQFFEVKKVVHVPHKFLELVPKWPSKKESKITLDSKNLVESLEPR
jgi:hypothetical protein